jgi:hypothetical protein
MLSRKLKVKAFATGRTPFQIASALGTQGRSTLQL